MSGFKTKISYDMKFNCGNKSAREIVDNSVQHDRNMCRLIDTIKENLKMKIVFLLLVNSKEQLGDDSIQKYIGKECRIVKIGSFR